MKKGNYRPPSKDPKRERQWAQVDSVIGKRPDEARGRQADAVMNNVSGRRRNMKP
jgi:hypothetical protein